MTDIRRRRTCRSSSRWSYLFLPLLAQGACGRARNETSDTTKANAASRPAVVAQPSKGEVPQTRAERDSLLREIARHRQHWTRAGVTSYTVSSKLECHCVPEPDGFLKTEVRGGRAIATRNSAGRIVHYGGETVSDVFNEADSLVRGRAQVVEVKFDSALGYPTEIINDPRVDVFDDHFLIRIRVEPLIMRRSNVTPGRVP